MLDSDGILHLEKIPDALLVVGAGVIGIEYASMFAALGSRVTVVEARPQLLDFCDAEIVEALRYHLRDLNVVFRLNEEVVGVDEHEGGTITHLKSGKRILADTVLYSAGRQGATDALDLGNVGIEADSRGRISRRRALPHVGRAHLRGRRRHRLPEPGGDLDGAGPARSGPRLRHRRRGRSPSRCRSASTRSPRSASSAAPRSS